MLTSTLQRWQAEDQLRGLNNRLEQQVEGRTAKLHDTVTRLRQEVKDRQRAETALQEMMTSLEQRLADRTEELATFFDLTVLAGQAVTMAGVFEQVLPRIAEVTRSRAICIHLLDADQSSLELTAQFNLPAQVGSGLQQVTLSPAFQNWLRQPNDPLTTTRLSSLENLPPVLQLSEYQTYLGSQIRVSTQAEGLLSCYRFTDRGFSLDEIALVTALAEQIGMMLEIHRLRQKAEEMAVLAERQRLARDLHDSLTQSLYSLSLFSRAGREAVEDGDKARLESSLTQLETNTLHALREMRLLLYELRPADLEQEGLTRALELRLNTVEQRVGLQLDIHLDDLPDLPPGFEAELYHLIVEALNNVVKHASATRLTVHLTLHPTETEPELHLLVADNGQGFDPAQTSGGLGLKNMRERVSRLGGCLTIDSRPNHGTRLEAVMPYLRETA
jgi:signal transduction histidine kinase